MTQSNYNNENEEDERMDEYDYIPISCIDDSENNLYLECGMIIRYSKMLFGRPNNRFVVTDIVENCVDCMLKIRLLDKHGKLDVECWEIYNPYYIKVLSDDEVIMLSKIEIDIHIKYKRDELKKLRNHIHEEMRIKRDLKNILQESVKQYRQQNDNY